MSRRCTRDDASCSCVVCEHRRSSGVTRLPAAPYVSPESVTRPRGTPFVASGPSMTAGGEIHTEGRRVAPLPTGWTTVPRFAP